MEFGSWSFCQQRSTTDERRTAADMSCYGENDHGRQCCLRWRGEWNVLAVVVAFVAELDYA